MGRKASVAATQLHCSSEKATTDDTQDGVGCALVELYLLKRAGLGLSVTVADPYFTSGVGTLAFRLNFPGYNVTIKG